MKPGSTFAVGALLAMTLLLACQSSPTSDVRAFEYPAEYVGREIYVCGYVNIGFESSNIWRSRREAVESRGVGLGLERVQEWVPPAGERNISHQCFHAVVFRSGCGGELICNSSSFDYAVRKVC